MKENVSNGTVVTPMLFPYEPELFWLSIRQIIREEVQSIDKQKPAFPSFETPGLTNKPLYKIAEVCA
ncbi:MAG: helix-turn-helix domain-containing protein, partial [Segetibacter sp.]